MGWGERFRARREWDGEAPQKPIVPSPADGPDGPSRAQLAATGEPSYDRDRADRLRRALCEYVDYCQSQGYFVPLSIRDRARQAIDQPRF